MNSAKFTSETLPAAQARCRVATVGILTLQLILSPAFAQGPQRKPNSSGADLAEFNLTRVAATAAQIENVLRKEPSLFLELKRWIANEAASRGQIVEDADLADQTVLKRLQEDIEFRAAATRLLQRYGFLLAKLNPESELARQRDLVLQEKAKLIARAELEEENRLFQQPPQQVEAAKEMNRSGNGGNQTVRRTPGQQGPQRELPPQTREPSMTAPEVETSAREQLLQKARANNLGSLDAAAPAATPLGLLDADRTSERNPLGLDGGARLSDLQAGRATRDMDELAQSAKRARLGREDRTRAKDWKDTGDESGGLAYRPNPYSSIPALYDLYHQAAPRPAKLERFGTEVLLRNSEFEDQLPMDLPVGPDYVVGPGDTLSIDIWGGVSQRLQRLVDREGRIALPEAGPLLVSGKTMGEVQRTVQQLLRTQFRDVSADVSLARLRTIRVFVVGDVERPGPYEVSSLSTPLNALFQAAGPTERGSFRILKHLRGKQMVQEVDVYDLLLRGIRSDLKRLENGDTVLIPTLGSTVKVEGLVRRPAIYELRNEKTLAEVLDLAGGILPTATLRNIQVQRLEANEKRTMLSVHVDPKASREDAEKVIRDFRIGDNDEVRIFPIVQSNQEAVYLEGHVLRPGKYSYRSGMKVTDLFKSYEELLPEPAPKYAEIVRITPPDFRPSVESFDLRAALENPSRAPELKPLDTVRIFGRFDFEDPPTVWVGGEVHKPGAYLTSGVVRLRDAVHLAGGATPDASLASAQVFRTMPDSSLKIFSVHLGRALDGDPADNIPMASRDRVVIHRNLAKVDPASVYIKGEVSKPGRYPLTSNMRVADLVRVAGGLKRSADLQSADLTRFVQESGQPMAQQQTIDLASVLSGNAEEDLPLRDGDTVAIRQLSGWTDIAAAITVRGEVNAPGTFGIRPGEKLSSIVRRAGGYRDTAYPAGALLERLTVRDIQERNRAELLLRIQDEIDRVKISLKEAPRDQLDMQQATMEQLRRAMDRLKETPVRGNLVVRLRPDLKRFENSPEDIEVRAGDVLTIPKQPGYVLVAGQVYHPSAIAFRGGKSAGWYLEKGGGPNQLANKKDIFIVRANGEVVTSSGGWWNGLMGESIQPGDTIFVPEKPLISSFWARNATTIAQILSSAGVSLAVLLQ